jgi:hypothetical protein
VIPTVGTSFVGDRVLRTFMSLPRRVRVCGLKWLQDCRGKEAVAKPRIAPSSLRRTLDDACYALQHWKLPFFSDACQVCFTAAQGAPLLHFDM